MVSCGVPYTSEPAKHLIPPTYQFPSIEVHTGKLAIVGLINVHVERLTLIDVGTPVGGHLEYCLL